YLLVLLVCITISVIVCCDVFTRLHFCGCCLLEYFQTNVIVQSYISSIFNKVLNCPAFFVTLLIPIRIIWRQHPLDAAAPPFAGRRRRLTRLETMNCSRGRGSAPNILRVRGLTVRGYGFIE